ncbi:MAG: class I SAM-dependent DNA methyltransferase [Magnetococcales bacterium]|nr:class I SAM-dependent DNA methyltransferase [Magnetococcales bacterium]
MPLSWNEIRDRALRFSQEWNGEDSENAEAKSFWDQFFLVFGVTRRRIASFERPVKKSDGKGGFIDLLWKGKLIVEHKSKGKNLDKAFHQALDYFPGLKDRDLPRYVIVSDFANFRLYDLDEEKTHNIPLKDFHKNIHLFGFIAGYETRFFGEENPVNIRAAEQLGKLHDQLLESGYEGHELEVLLVRLLFCVFAEDTSIFEPNQFREYIDQRTSVDGSDLGPKLTKIFQVLNNPKNKRQKKLDEQLAEFPYVNGRLFEEILSIQDFDRSMRETLLDCCALDWSKISPAIFGSLFQSIMDKKARRNLGAHYTTEINILKALRPLFLDSLSEELKGCGNSRKKLLLFQNKLANIRILDPACGCGNFIVIAYRELRLLELEVLKKTEKTGQKVLDLDPLIKVNVDQFYGIEIEEFPAQIAQVALWLIDHQLNMRASEMFGQYFNRLPLKKSATISFGVSALSLSWTELVNPSKLSYIVGNPPFIGAKFLKAEQKTERNTIFDGIKGAGLLDYVTCWHKKASAFMLENPSIHTAFVSTNSITQGEQAGALWNDLLSAGIQINFAHRTFQWSSEARGKAAVHCVIIGFGIEEALKKWIFEYEDVRGEPHRIQVKNISPYLVDAASGALQNRTTPICDVPKIGIGNKPIDDGNYLFTPEEKAVFLANEPQAEPYFRRWFGSREFINGVERWCLWLGDASPSALRKMPLSLERVKAVKSFRLKSTSAPTQKLAHTPTRFHVENMPENNFYRAPDFTGH